MRNNLSQPEPKPKSSEGTPIWELVIKDMQDRDKFGREKYGTPLKAFNGRVAVIDEYQELLDRIVYRKQDIIEREWEFEKLEELKAHLFALSFETGKQVSRPEVIAMNLKDALVIIEDIVARRFPDKD